MPTNKKSPKSSFPKQVYSTRKIMEITEARRLEKENRLKTSELPKVPENEIPSVLENHNFLKITAHSSLILKEVETFTSQVNLRPPTETLELEPISQSLINETGPNNGLSIINIVFGFFVFVFWTLLFQMSLAFMPQVTSLVNKLNLFIIHGSYLILKLLHVPCSVKAEELNCYNYTVSLQGDLIAFYSLALLVAFSSLHPFIKKDTWVNKGVYVFLIPLAMFANILRVVFSAAIALNYSGLMAGQCFLGALQGLVFVTIVLGLIILELL